MAYPFSCSDKTIYNIHHFYCNLTDSASLIKSARPVDTSAASKCEYEGWRYDSVDCTKWYWCYYESGRLTKTDVNTAGICASKFRNCTSLNDDLCMNRADGYYAFPNKCKSFYSCYSGKSYLRDCTVVDNTKFSWNFFCDTPANIAYILSAPAVKSIEMKSGSYANLCDAEGWMSDEESCDLYFRCSEQDDGSLLQTSFNIKNICQESIYVSNCTRTVT